MATPSQFPLADRADLVTTIRSDEAPPSFRIRSKKIQTQIDACLANPDRVLFLDIETTGLSHYYDDITVIGWALGGLAETVVRGMSIDDFRHAASKAIGLITFNGIRFDTRFIARDYPDLLLPDLHIDLMYLCRRAGLTGGQKAIERELGICVRGDIEDLDGAGAVALWHQYIRGDTDSLRRLIAYNRADIAAMGAILDQTLARLEIHPNLFSSEVRFVEWSAPNNWKTVPRIRKPSQRLKEERLTFDRLFGGQAVSELRVVGIDLTSSKERLSGWALLQGNECNVESLGSDQEIIDRTISATPDLVSIDSPLCLPAGRISVGDDDPGRERYGIMRECERELKRRGINVYPCLIPSMQKLTERGIRIASQFRERGVPVIESYPGAAQDIMKIPRKGAGTEWLRKGLREFGILGKGPIDDATHDELDAITSALVGMFQWVGMSEELGTEEEEPLVIPCKVKRSVPYVVGISGPIAAGKTTVARILENEGFAYTRFSLSIDDMLIKKKIIPSRSTRQAMGTELHTGGRQRWLCYRTLERVHGASQVVVDGLRFPEDRACLTEIYGEMFKHIHVNAGLETRRKRYEHMAGNDGFDEATEADVEQGVGQLASLAHEVYMNEQSMSKLESYVAHLMFLRTEGV